MKVEEESEPFLLLAFFISLKKENIIKNNYYSVADSRLIAHTETMPESACVIL